MPNPVIEVAPYGLIEVVPIERDRLRVEAGIPHNDPDPDPLVINGVPYSVQGFMYLWSDRRWHLGREDDRMSQLHEPRLSRVGTYPTPEPSRSAYAKARTGIEHAVNVWADDSLGQLALARANEAWQTKQLVNAEEKIAQAAKALEEAEAERASALGWLELARRHVRELES